MAAVWEQRFSNLIRRVLDLRESAALEALPDLMPVINVLDHHMEMSALRGERWASGTRTQAAVAAQGSAIQLRNTSPDRTFIVELVEAISGANDVVGMAIEGLALGGASAGRYTDGRQIGQTTGLVVEGEAAAGHPTVGNWHFAMMAPAATPARLAPQVLLIPGQALRVESLTQNVALRVSFQWRERALQTAESQGV